MDFKAEAPDDDRLFDCPFVRRYPDRYLKCYGHSLKDVSRVKFHLFRNKAHRLPMYCPTCSATFESEPVRDEHIRDANCIKKSMVLWEGFTGMQRDRLGKRSTCTTSPEVKWYTIFGVLFPTHALPRSPFIDLSLSG
jgi:hypothetical protein